MQGFRNYKQVTFAVFFLITVQLVITASGNADAFYTKAEEEALSKFRSLVENDLYMSYMKSDAYLIRWLRIKNLNVESARDMLLRSLQWRRNNKIDTILDEDTSRFRKGYPVYNGGVDKEGRPVCLLPIGKWDLRKAAVSGHSAMLQRYFYYIVEKEVKMIREIPETTGKNVTQFILIIDLGGFSLRTHGCLPCLSTYVGLISNLESNYPLLTKHAFLINSPRVLTSLLQPFAPILSQVSRDTLVIYGTDKSEWRKVLLDLIPQDQLPPPYGGTKIYDQQ